MKSTPLPEGAFTEKQLEQCHDGKPNLSHHRFYLVQYGTSATFPHGYAVVQPCNGSTLQFNAGDVFYYFDNYFYAWACALKLREARHE